MPRSSDSRNVTGYSSTININATNRIPDAVFNDIHLFLSQVEQGPLDVASFKKLKIDNFYPWTPCIKVQDDFLDDRESNPEVAARLLLMMLLYIPIVSVKLNEDYETNCLEDDLGRYYCRQFNDPIYGNRPHIEIFTDRVRTCFPDEKSYRRVLVYTIIHELAHALMDVENYGFADKYSKEYKRILPGVLPGNAAGCAKLLSLDFYTVREESFANMLSYDIMWKQRNRPRSLSTKYPQKDLLKFFNEQPLQYKLAANLYYISPYTDFFKWMRCKAFQRIEDPTARKWLEMAIENVSSNYHGTCELRDCWY